MAVLCSVVKQRATNKETRFVNKIEKFKLYKPPYASVVLPVNVTRYFI